MMICRTLRAAFIGLWLSGCSVVVFEDGPACPADRACPVVEMPSAAPADAASAKAENAAPAQITDETSDQSLDQAPSKAATKQAKIDINIDGHLSYFDYDSAVLSQQTLSGLLLVADYLKSNLAVQILIEGHCDERGTRDYNLALGARRASAVRDALVSFGVSPEQVSTISYGKERPVSVCSENRCWSKNRRSVTVIR